MDQNERLLGHDRWMTNLMFDAAALDRNFDIGHRTVRNTLDHIRVGIELWTSLMQGESARWDPNPSDIDTMRERYSAAYDSFEAVVHRVMAEERTNETFTDPWDYQQSFGATILHVNLHSHGHRSELLHMFDRLGLARFTEGDPQEWEHMAGLTPPLVTPEIVFVDEVPSQS